MSARRSIRILHVDDEPRLCDLVETLLEEKREAFEVVTRTDPDEALSYLDANAVDCVVSDYDMPKMDGLELLEAVRETYPDLPFILFTGKGTEEIASRAISAGVTDYLQKGGGTDQYTVLANRIRHAVKRRERDRQYERLVDNLPGIVYRNPVAPDRTEAVIAGDVEEITGYDADELADGDPLWSREIVHPDDSDRVWQDIKSQLREGDSFEVTYRIVTNGGETRWVLERGKQVGESSDGVPRIEGVVSDITERKHRQRELQEEKRFIEQALDALNDVFYVIAPDGDIRRWNSKGTELLGYSDAELAEMDALDVFPADHHDRISDAVEEILSTGQATVEADFLTTDGERITHEFVGRKLTDTDGTVRGIAGIGRNISERKEREHELERYEQFVEYSPNFFVLLDRDMTIEYQSPMSPLAEWEPLDVSGEPALEYVHEDDHEKVLTHFHRLLSNPDEIARAEFRIKDPTDEWRWVESRAQNFLDQAPIEGVLVTLQGITERKERERELERQNERLEEFARVVSHDLKNPLNVASGRLELVRAEYDSDHLVAIERSIDRMETLVEDLLQLARQGRAVGDVDAVDLRDVTTRCWNAVETGTADLNVATDEHVRADETRLRELFENLFDNAVEHGGEGVTVTVGDLGDGFYVADDGEGISPANSERIFEGGYSQREAGTGFGLAIVRQIVEAHDWEIRATESDTGGARFEVVGVDRPATENGSESPDSQS